MKKNQIQKKMEAFVAEVQKKVEELLGTKKAPKRRSKPKATKKKKARPAKKKRRTVRAVERRIETSQ